MDQSKRSEEDGWERELALLESLRWSRKEFLDRICESSASRKESVLAILRLEATYQLAEFYFLLSARGIESEEDIRRLAEAHNEYIVKTMKDRRKMERLGLKADRVLDAMFTSDTLPRLVQTWRDEKRAIDQANLGRFLVGLMSAETCRKVVVACGEAGLLSRERSPYGTILVRSKGRLEALFGESMRELVVRIEGLAGSSGPD